MLMVPSRDAPEKVSGLFFISGIWKAGYPVLSKESTPNIQLGLYNRWPEAFLRTLENANVQVSLERKTKYKLLKNVKMYRPYQCF